MNKKAVKWHYKGLKDEYKHSENSRGKYYILPIKNEKPYNFNELQGFYFYIGTYLVLKFLKHSFSLSATSLCLLG